MMPARVPRLWGWLERLGKLLVILVPGLYLLGRTYEQAYWQGLGLGSALLDRSVESQLYLGYEVVWHTLAYGLARYASLGIPRAAMLMGGLLIGVGAVVAAVRVARLRCQRWVHRERAQLRSSLLLLGCGLATLLFAPSWGAWAGTVMAERTDQRFRLWSAPDRQQRNFTLVHLKENADAPSTEALLLECGSRWCVYFDGYDFVAVAPERIARLQGCLRIEALSAGGLACNNKALPVPR